MPDKVITLTGTPLAVDASWTTEQFHQAVLQSIGGTISTNNIMLGKIGGAVPTANIGPWLDGAIWKVWFAYHSSGNGTITAGSPTITCSDPLFNGFTVEDVGMEVHGLSIPIPPAHPQTVIKSVESPTSATMSANALATHINNLIFYVGVVYPGHYRPVIPSAGPGNATGQGLYISLVGIPTASRLITLQDKDGTIALTSDIYGARATNYPTIAYGSTTTVDWSLSNSFGLPGLTGSTSIVMANAVSGQEINILATNSNTGALTWASSNVHWPNNTAPTLSAGTASTNFIIRDIGGQLYGQVLQPY